MRTEVEAYHPPPLRPAVLATVVAVGPPFPWVGVLAAAVVANLQLLLPPSVTAAAESAASAVSLMS